MFLKTLMFLTILASCVFTEEDCKKCKSRTYFGLEPPSCICEDTKFCNETTSKCQQCSTVCFKYWNKIVVSDADKFWNKLEQLVNEYEVDLKILKTVLKSLDVNFKKGAETLKKLNLVINQTDQNIVDVRYKVDILKKDLEEMKNSASFLEAKPPNVDVIMEEVREFGLKIEDLLKQLLEVNLDPVAEKTIKEMKKKIEGMQNDIKGLNELPSIDTESSLNLALHIENGLDLLDSTLLRDDTDIDFHKYEEHLQPIHWNMVKLISYILDIMNNSGIVKKYADEVEKLKKDSSNLKNLANSLKSTLVRIMKDEESFYEAHGLIKKEILDFKNIQELQKWLKVLEDEIKKAGDVTEEFKENLKQVMSELDVLENKFYNSLEALKQENETLHKHLKALEASAPQLDELLEDALIQREALEGLEEYKFVEKLEEEIDEMINKIDIYSMAFEEYCKDAREHEIAALKIR